MRGYSQHSRKQSGGAFWVPLIFLAARLGVFAFRAFRVMRVAARTASTVRKIVSASSKLKKVATGIKRATNGVKHVAKRVAKKQLKKQIKKYAKKQIKKKAKDTLKDELENQIESRIFNDDGGHETFIQKNKSKSKNVNHSRQNMMIKKRMMLFGKSLSAESSTNKHRHARNHMEWAANNPIKNRVKRS